MATADDRPQWAKRVMFVVDRWKTITGEDSDREFCRRADIGESYVSGLRTSPLRGRESTPTLAIIEKIASFASKNGIPGVTVEWLMTETGPGPDGVGQNVVPDPVPERVAFVTSMRAIAHLIAEPAVVEAAIGALRAMRFEKPTQEELRRHFNEHVDIALKQLKHLRDTIGEAKSGDE